MQHNLSKASMCECLMDSFSHKDKCPIDFSESGHLPFKEQVLIPSLHCTKVLTGSVSHQSSST